MLLYLCVVGESLRKQSYIPWLKAVHSDVWKIMCLKTIGQQMTGNWKMKSTGQILPSSTSVSNSTST